MNKKKMLDQRYCAIVLLLLFAISACTTGIENFTSGGKAFLTPSTESFTGTIMPPLTPEPSPLNTKSYAITSEPTQALILPSLSPETIIVPKSDIWQTLMPSLESDAGEVVYMELSDTGSVISSDFNLPENGGWIDRQNMIRIESTISLTFANHAELIAYMDFDGQIWVADIANRNPVMIYQYPQPPSDYPELIWTPNDHYLVIHKSIPGETDYIFNIITGKLQKWNYICNRIAMSPKSHVLSIWCTTQSITSSFAVLEWNDEIWYSETPPENELFRSYENVNENSYNSPYRLFPILRNVGWSSDGATISYFDPTDPNGDLIIANVKGEILQRIDKRAPWLTDWIKEGRPLPIHPVQWSGDGSRILFYGIGEAKKECPNIIDSVHEKAYTNPACWQVIDVSSGMIIWSIANIVTQEPAYRINATFDTASISNNGRFLVTYSFFPGDYKVYVIDTETGKVLFSPPFRVEETRWGFK